MKKSIIILIVFNFLSFFKISIIYCQESAIDYLNHGLKLLKFCDEKDSIKFAKSDFQTARNNLSKDHPRRKEVFAGLAQVYFILGEYNNSIKNCNSALHIDSKYAWPLKIIAKIYYIQEKYSLAKKNLLKAKGDIEVDTLLARIYFEEDNCDSVRKILKSYKDEKVLEPFKKCYESRADSPKPDKQKKITEKEDPIKSNNFKKWLLVKDLISINKNREAINEYKKLVKLEDSYLDSNLVLGNKALPNNYFQLIKYYFGTRENISEYYHKKLKTIADTSKANLKFDANFLLGLSFSRIESMRDSAKTLFAQILHKNPKYEGCYFRKNYDKWGYLLFAEKCYDLAIEKGTDTNLLTKSMKYCFESLLIDSNFNNANILMNKIFEQMKRLLPPGYWINISIILGLPGVIVLTLFIIMLIKFIFQKNKKIKYQNSYKLLNKILKGISNEEDINKSDVKIKNRLFNITEADRKEITWKELEDQLKKRIQTVKIDPHDVVDGVVPNLIKINISINQVAYAFEELYLIMSPSEDFKLNLSKKGKMISYRILNFFKNLEKHKFYKSLSYSIICYIIHNLNHGIIKDNDLDLIISFYEI